MAAVMRNGVLRPGPDATYADGDDDTWLDVDWAALQEPVVRRSRLRRAAMQWVIRYPEKLSVPLAHELVLSFGKPGFVPALKALLEYSYRDRLAQIRIPVLIVWGRNDLLVPVGDAERYRRLIGDNARVEIFEDTGHAPMIERPSRFNELLRGFLAEEGAGEARVTAPPDAPPPSPAHFARTPPGEAGAGAR